MDLALFYQEVTNDISLINTEIENNVNLPLEITQKYIELLHRINFEENFKNLYGEKQVVCVKGVLNCMGTVKTFSEKLITKDFVLSMLIGLNKIKEF